MNQNPYAPPGAAVPPPTVPFGQPQAWTAGEALSIAWARFKEYAAVLVLSYFIYLVLAGVVGQMGNILKLAGGGQSKVVLGLLTMSGALVGQLVSSFLEVGAIRISLDAARGKPPTLETLFSGADRFIPLLLTNIVLGLAVVVGLMLLIVPGVIIALGYSMAPFYVVEARMGPLAAMSASWNATRGQKSELFVLGFAGLGLTLLGLMMCCVGILATSPIIYVAGAVAFVRMSGLGTVAPAVAGAPPPPALPFQ